VFDALMFDKGTAARLRLCSRRDNNWTSLLVRLFDNAEVVDDLVLPPIAEQTLVLVTDGRKTVECLHGKRWLGAEYGPGRIGLTAPGNETRIRWHGSGRTQTTHVYLPSGLMERTAAELWGHDARFVRAPDALVIDDPVIAAVMNGLGEAALAGANELYAESASTFLAVHLLSRHGSRPVTPPLRGEDVRVRRVISFLRMNHHLPLTLTEIAAVADLSTFHFLRMFKAATGQTPYKFLNHIRVQRARGYLERSDLSVTEIAQLCGFTTPSQLATAFRQETGVSPTAYRNGQQ
jgi:AraC family transcriptional regulator